MSCTCCCCLLFVLLLLLLLLHFFFSQRIFSPLIFFFKFKSCLLFWISCVRFSCGRSLLSCRFAGESTWNTKQSASETQLKTQWITNSTTTSMSCIGIPYYFRNDDITLECTLGLQSWMKMLPFCCCCFCFSTISFRCSLCVPVGCRCRENVICRLTG